MILNFNLMNWVYRKLHRQLKKYISITFYFVKNGPGHVSEDVKEECNVNCFHFSLFSLFLMEVMGGKITVNLKELH